MFWNNYAYQIEYGYINEIITIQSIWKRDDSLKKVSSPEWSSCNLDCVYWTEKFDVEILATDLVFPI